MTIVEYHGGRIDRRYLDKRSKSEIIQMHLDLLRAWERRESVMADAVTPALLYLQTQRNELVMSCSRIRARTDGTFEPIPNTLDPEAEPFLGELDAMIEALIPLVQKDPT